MRNKHSLRGLTLISLTTLVFVGLYAARISSAETNAVTSRVAVPTIEKYVRDRNEFTSSSMARPAISPSSPLIPTCPDRTVRVGNQCVLRTDITLTQTLVLPSNTTLNCMGHTIRPKVDSPVTLTPQVGIFLNHIENVRIQQCIIEGFDFGVFAINSKKLFLNRPFKSFEMSCNTIKSRYTSVSLMSVDNAEITGNDISYTRAGGTALYIGRDSDSNAVLYNTFLADLVPGDTPQAFRVPGPASDANPPLPSSVSRGGVVVIAQIEGGEPTLLNAVVNGTLFQLSSPNVPDSSSKFSRGNIFEANTIRFTSVPVDGIALAIPQNSSVINNRIEAGADNAIRVGMQNDFARTFPGMCQAAPHLACVPDSCPNPPNALVNRCMDPATGQPVASIKVNWISRNTRIEGNEILGPTTVGIATTGENTRISGNTIAGPFRDPAAVPNINRMAGIRLVGERALNTSTVRRNTVNNVGVALNLVEEFQKLDAVTFNSQISLNDFTGYSIAVLTSKTPNLITQDNGADIYDVTGTELSANGQGNFWLSLSEISTICRGLKPADVQHVDHSRNPVVTDSNPFGSSVARRPLGQLPGRCFVTQP